MDTDYRDRLLEELSETDSWRTTLEIQLELKYPKRKNKTREYLKKLEDEGEIESRNKGNRIQWKIKS